MVLDREAFRENSVRLDLSLFINEVIPDGPSGEGLSEKARRQTGKKGSGRPAMRKGG
jgi:hypothetical protein